MINVHFTKRNSLMSFIVRLFTTSKYSHVEIEIDGTCYSAMLGKGVYKRPAKEMFEDQDVIESWAAVSACEYKIPLEGNKDIIKDLKKFLEPKVGKKYDIMPVIGLGLWRRGWTGDDSKWFCSELVDAAFKAIHTNLTNEDFSSYRLTPNDLRSSPQLEFKSLLYSSVNRTFMQKFWRWFK